MRPTARSLSACSASAVGGPPVWSHMIHRTDSAGTVPVCKSALKFCSHWSTRHWSGMFRSNTGKCATARVCTDGISEIAFGVVPKYSVASPRFSNNWLSAYHCDQVGSTLPPPGGVKLYLDG